MPTSVLRTCYVCKCQIESVPLADGRRHNCVSLGGSLLGDLPASCWQRSDHPYIRDIVATVGSYRQSDATSDRAHESRLCLAKLIEKVTAEGTLDRERFDREAKQFKRRDLVDLLRRLPADSPLVELLKQPISLLTAKKPVAPAEQVGSRKVSAKALAARPSSAFNDDTLEMPPDFKKALDLYEAASKRRAELKIARGHNYDPLTAERRLEDARKFCVFLVRQGVETWPNVAVSHLNAFLSVTNRRAAQRAWTFLNFLYGRFPLMSKIPRPRNKNKAAAGTVALLSEAKEAVSRLAKHPDPQVALAGLFLAMYAQNVAHSHRLKLSNFRRENGAFQAKFHGEWMPLDPVTERLFCGFRPEFASNGYRGPSEPLFTTSEGALVSAVARTAGVALKPLRLAAISNLLRSGMTDRGAIRFFLGVSMPTIQRVEETVYWDLQSTVAPEIVESRNEVIRGERRE
ncbi:MAG TPA: hypothetical protein PK958_13795 [Rhodocyclaceae bacterium]|nr:hypothetical protein [Rhodocyclaceae bacterium]